MECLDGIVDSALLVQPVGAAPEKQCLSIAHEPGKPKHISYGTGRTVFHGSECGTASV